MNAPPKKKASLEELHEAYATRLGMPKSRIIVHRHPQLGFYATLVTDWRDMSAGALAVEQATAALRLIYDLEDDAPPKLAAQPGFDARTQTILFEFWKGNERQLGSLTVPHTDATAALDFFKAHWRQIGAMAAKIPATDDGIVKLAIVG